jgi:predicted amino acid-binding ACT domain protein
VKIAGSAGSRYRPAMGFPRRLLIEGEELVMDLRPHWIALTNPSAYIGFHDDAAIRSEEETLVRYYIVLSVADQPGVLSEVAGVFARNGVSIASVRQEGFGNEATLMLITHIATEGQHRATLAELRGHGGVRSIESTIRVEGTQEG